MQQWYMEMRTCGHLASWIVSSQVTSACWVRYHSYRRWANMQRCNGANSPHCPAVRELHIAIQGFLTQHFCAVIEIALIGKPMMYSRTGMCAGVVWKAGGHSWLSHRAIVLLEPATHRV